MKKIYVFAFMAAIILSACSKGLTPEVNPDGEMVLVHLNLSGEIDVEDSPLTKAFTTDDLIGVQVYQGSDYYAYGLFDDVSKMNLYLHSNKTYSFVCTVVKNGKGIVYHRTSSGSSSSWYPASVQDNEASDHTKYIHEGEYSFPFIRNEASNSRLLRGTKINNAFSYYRTNDNNHFTKDLQYGTIATGVGEGKKYPKADRFYGEVSGYKPEGNGSLSIPLKRVSFGITLTVSGITDGNVTVTIKNSTQTFESNTGIAQDTQFGTTTWSFFDLKSAWQYADNYAENFTVGVVWNRGVGVTQDLGTKTVQFKRNAVNHVRIDLSTSTKSAGIAVSLEEPEITNETYSFGN